MDHFLPFYPTNNPKNQDFETMKKTTGVIIEKSKFYNNEKTPGDIIILHMRTKNYDHRRYSF